MAESGSVGSGPRRGDARDGGGDAVEKESADAALVARLRAGDATAFAAVIADTVPALLRYAERLAPRGADVEDLVQDVLARVWVSRATLTVSISVRAYLFVAIRNAANNLHKHERVIQMHAMDVWSDDVAVDPGAHLVGRVTVEQLLATLPPRRREAVVLRYLGELSFAEVAQVLGTTRVNAERLVARSLETLRRVAAELGETGV